MYQTSAGDSSAYLIQLLFESKYIALKRPGECLLAASLSHIMEVQIRTYT